VLLAGCRARFPALPAAPVVVTAASNQAMPPVATPGASGAHVEPALSHGQAQLTVIRSWLDWSDLALTLAAVAALILALWWRSAALGTLALALGVGAASCAFLAWLAPIRQWLFLGAGLVGAGVLWYRHRQAISEAGPPAGTVRRFVRHAARVLGPGRATVVPSGNGLAWPVLLPRVAQADNPAAVTKQTAPEAATVGREGDHGPPSVV
jgi:hypothetical protein